MFLEISENSQENTCARVSLAQVFSCEFCEISENTFLQNTSGRLLLLVFSFWQIFLICNSNFSLLSVTIPKNFYDLELSIVVLAILMLASSCMLSNKWHLLEFAFIWLLAKQVNNFWVILVRFFTTSIVLFATT